MVRFEYLEPTSIKDACEVLSQCGSQAKVLAGGTDLLKHLKERTLRPRYVVNIKRIPDLAGFVDTAGQGLRMGSMTKIRDLETSFLVKEKYPALAQAAHFLGSPQVRNLATLGGNLCNAAPSAETAPSLLTFSVTAQISGPQGERTIPLEAFFTGPGSTVLQEGELLTGIFLPEPLPGTGSVYLKHCPRGSMDLAIVGVAAAVRLSPDGVGVEDCSIGLGAVAPTPLRAKAAEGILRGKEPGSGLIEEVAAKAAEESRPISDVRGSAEYRREMVKVLTARALSMALEEARLREAKGKEERR